MQVIVVGGGIQGLSCAAALAEGGHLVQLLERERPGQRASWVAAGLLTPSSPWKYPQPLIDLCHRSEALYADWCEDLRRHTGVDPQLEDGGMIYPAPPGDDGRRLREMVEQRVALGFDVRLLDRAALDARQPGLGPEVDACGWQPHGFRVRPPRLLAALRRRVDQLGVLVVSGCDVRALEVHGGRCTGVTTAGGQALEADAVVLAAGAWSAALASTASVQADVRPVRGQILLLRGAPGTLGPTINDGDSYLVPRDDGRVLVGSTMEDAGFSAVVTEEGLAALRARARRLLPAAADMREELAWAGLRPGTPDRLPFLGAVDDVPGLVLATGHFRNGILLAPLTGRIVADVLAGGAPPVDLSPFAPRACDPARAPKPRLVPR